MKFNRIITALLTLAATATMTSQAATPRYIFYFIGDGMGFGHVMAGETFNRVALGNPTPLLMLQFPAGGMLQTYSASSTVTDSAAAGTALATGHKTRNGMLGMTPDSVAVPSMAEMLHNDGWGVALVTNVSPDDATPGAFYAHVPSRSESYNIGRQAIESGYEFIAGSAWRGAPGTDLLEQMDSAGIDRVTSTEAARESDSRRVFLYSAEPFNDSNIGFTIDSIAGALTLPDMTAAAIEHMKRVSPDRFFMMVEGGNIDHTAHGNDGATVAVEVHNFDKALAEAYAFYTEHPEETVIVVTADHETGGLSLGNRAVGYTSNLQYVPAQRVSKDSYSRAVKKMLSDDTDLTWDEFKAFTAARTGLWNPVPVKEKQEEKLKEMFEETFEKRRELADEKTLYSSFNALANEVFRVLNDNQGFGWTTGGHSGNPVPVFAVGEGMETIIGPMNNTEIAPRLLKLAGYSLPRK